MNGKEHIRIHGRDFRGYRIGGAIVAVLFLILLIWQAVYLFQGYNVVVPEVAWVAGENAPAASPPPNGAREAAPTGLLASEILTQRTQLMRPRAETGPAPDNPPPPLAIGSQEYLGTAPLNVDDATITRAWSIPTEATAEIMRPSERVEGWTAVPYPNADLFERPEGRSWRHGIADWATHYGALALLGMIALLGLVLALRGRIPISTGRDGREVERFGFLERAIHWMTAGSFVMLALTGVVIAFGATLFGPYTGEGFLGDIGWISTWGHMIFAPPFFLGIAAEFIIWVLRALPEPRLDLPWLARLGGLMSDDPDKPSARKFNAGQKGTFWIAVLGGLVMTGTGITLMFPYFWLGLSGMVWMMLAHAIIGLSMTAFFIAHAYIGSVGMQDAIHAMWSGKVDLNWAREQHDLWLDELARKGKLPPGTHEPGTQTQYRTAPAGSSAPAPGREREA
ncbi:MAG TPA: formate dehydrogenase subunit gamma [Paracoccaceae bacterium]|nr:formate dehydrogenase subunit gamma [Paracoccaceae bacterium]